MSFDTLGLQEPILAGIRTAGYEQPTEIQQLAIPHAIAGRNLIALGQTGSGKTAAFGLPILNKLIGGEPGLRAVILVPTRELCVQVAENLRKYASHTGLHVCTAFGGIDIGIQTSAFKRGLDVLVACPGRLIDHLERGNLTLTDVKVVVLDEADRMLDMGFMPQIRSILVRCPDERQNLLFSATMPPEVDELCKRFVPGAERVQIGRRSQAASTIQHRFVGVDAKDKLRYLTGLLGHESGRVLVFVRTKIAADKLGRTLSKAGLPADSIHGDKSAESRHVVLKGFDAGRIRFMVATDVAARGIDIDNVELVVNYDLPMAVEDYIHRVGRTGRAGASGRAISLVGSVDKQTHRQIVKHLNASVRAAQSAKHGEDAGVEPAQVDPDAPDQEARDQESREAKPRRARRGGSSSSSGRGGRKARYARN